MTYLDTLIKSGDVVCVTRKGCGTEGLQATVKKVHLGSMSMIVECEAMVFGKPLVMFLGANEYVHVDVLAKDDSATHTPAIIKNVPKGEYIRFKVDGPVYVRDSYNREEGKYECYKADDINSIRLVKSTQQCFIGFTY